MRNAISPAKIKCEPVRSYRLEYVVDFLGKQYHFIWGYLKSGHI